MSEFLSSPFGLVTAGLVVLAVSIILLVIWIVVIDRRMRGVVDGLETERRKVAEMQMVIGRRNAARGYGAPRPAAPQPQRPDVQPDPRTSRQARVQQNPDSRTQAAGVTSSGMPRAGAGQVAAAPEQKAAASERPDREQRLHGRARRGTPNIPRGVDKTQVDARAARAAAPGQAGSAARSGSNARAAAQRSAAGQAGASRVPSGARAAHAAAPARAAQVDQSQARAQAAACTPSQASEQERRRAERAARQKRMAERRMQIATAQEQIAAAQSGQARPQAVRGEAAPAANARDRAAAASARADQPRGRHAK